MIEEGKEIEKHSTKIEKSNDSSYLDIAKLDQIKLLVSQLKDSTLGSQFIDKFYDKDEDGNIDESTEKKIFNEGDMILCLGLGAELGLSPWEALSYGKSLNLSSIKKIRKGEKLGVDYSTALDQIYIWGTGSKEIVYTSIHIVNAVLTRIGVKRDILNNGKIPTYIYTDARTDKITDYDALHCKVIPRNLAPDDLLTVLQAFDTENLTAVYKDGGQTAKVRLTRYMPSRKEDEVIEVDYSVQEAIDAGLYRGTKTDGSDSKGKDNWNAHLSVHLIKMCIMIGAREIASDVLQGVYIPEEITFIKNKDIESEVVDFTEVEQQ